MPASFTRDLCGYRPKNGKPNTSDASDDLSVRLGERFLEVLGVVAGDVKPDQNGLVLERKVIDCLSAVRPDLVIDNSYSALRFSQYEHLDVFPKFRSNYRQSDTSVKELESQVANLPDTPTRRRMAKLVKKIADGYDINAELVQELIGQMPEESLLKIDVAIGIPQFDAAPELAAALSVKWSLRTDRAQDCVSQGHKLVTQRRGRMPHFGVITAEPRPSMLRILADGSGAVDWVYHLDLPALAKAIELEARETRNPEKWPPKATFDRLMNQKRLRDFEDLVTLVKKLPKADTASVSGSLRSP
ncbi:NgoMIV family type II restriction endonuclease [Amycolatopsis pigmentata]|uniref:NgoMIV family type II restriction endonuclease n=1 Tax=Amycolatopsis pigmentata TaxID=450801 RepID=A0ABW5FRL6_9PSEU